MKSVSTLRPKAPVLNLVPRRDTTRELVAVFEGLLDLAKKGEITGLIFGVQLRDIGGGDKFYCDAAGSMHRYAVKAIGLAYVLIAELERRLQHEAEETVL